MGAVTEDRRDDPFAQAVPVVWCDECWDTHTADEHPPAAWCDGCGQSHLPDEHVPGPFVEWTPEEQAVAEAGVRGILRVKVFPPDACFEAGARRAVQRLGRLQLVADADVDQLPDPRWTIDGLVPEGLSVLYGAPGSFKSFIALDWAYRAQRSIYVMAEGRGGLKRRRTAWLIANGQPDTSGVFFVPQPVNLLDPDDVAVLSEYIAATEPQLVVIDTLARCMVGGEENSTRDMGLVVQALDDLDVPAKLVIHHTNAEGSRERGASALRAASDMMVRVDRDGDQLQVVCDRMKDHDEWSPMTFEKQLVGESMVLRQITNFEAVISSTDLRQSVLAYVAEHPQAATNQIAEAVSGRRREILATLDRLVENGALLVTPAARGAKLYEVAR